MTDATDAYASNLAGIERHLQAAVRGLPPG
jgi:hypothetical protein